MPRKTALVRCLAIHVVAAAFVPLARGAAQANEVAALSADLDGDGRLDRAVLTEDADDVTLTVTLASRDVPVVKPALGWMGGMAGQEPALSVRAGSLVVEFQNESIGRNRWQQQLTIAWRNGGFVVAGYTFTSRDTLDPDQGGTCDINFLDRRGVRNGRPVAISVGAVPLLSWTDAAIPAICRF